MSPARATHPRGLYGLLHQGHTRPRSARGPSATAALTRRAIAAPALQGSGCDEARATPTPAPADRARIAELVANPLGRGVVMASALVMALITLGRRRDEPADG